MNTQNSDHRVTTRAAMARYRAKVKRIDYIPAKDALELIERTRANNPDASYQMVIDDLLRAAGKAISGNARS